jgi:hypothetical protein
MSQKAQPKQLDGHPRHDKYRKKTGPQHGDRHDHQKPSGNKKNQAENLHSYVFEFKHKQSWFARIRHGIERP